MHGSLDCGDHTSALIFSTRPEEFSFSCFSSSTVLASSFSKLSIICITTTRKSLKICKAMLITVITSKHLNNSNNAHNSLTCNNIYPKAALTTVQTSEHLCNSKACTCPNLQTLTEQPTHHWFGSWTQCGWTLFSNQPLWDKTVKKDSFVTDALTMNFFNSCPQIMPQDLQTRTHCPQPTVRIYQKWALPF